MRTAVCVARAKRRRQRTMDAAASVPVRGRLEASAAATRAVVCARGGVQSEWRRLLPLLRPKPVKLLLLVVV